MRIVSLIFLLAAFSFPQDNSWMLYDDSQLAIINISTAPEAVAYMYENTRSDSFHYASMHFQNAHINETIDSVAIRLRGNTSRVSHKKSFKLDFEYFNNNREFYGVDKMNLNGEHNDPSIIRSKLSWDFFKEAGIISSRAAHCALYINGVYYGLYISVEHYDKEFIKKNFADPEGDLIKCLYGADLITRGDGSASNYDPSLTGSYSYELKTNKGFSNYNKLADLIESINNTSNFEFPVQVAEKMDLPGAIKVLAWDVLLGMWDGYWGNKNNYYLYYEPARDIFHFIPYDYDNIMSIDWFNKDWASENIYNWYRLDGGYRPLIDRILDNNALRNLYTHFIEFYSQNIFESSLWQPRLDSLYNTIETFALQDTFRTLDWGFTDVDFTNSYGFEFENQHVKRGILDYVNTRNQTVTEQAVYLSSDPIIYAYSVSPKNPVAGDSITVEASVFSPSELAAVQLYYTIDGNDFTIQDFNALPVTGTKKVEEFDRWSVIIPPVAAGSRLEFNIFAYDADNNATTYPLLTAIAIEIPSTGNENLYINEFLAQNTAVNSDENNQFEDWIEIFNSADSAIDISGYYLSDNPANLNKWQFPDSTPLIQPAGFLLVWCDEDQGQGRMHTNFKLASTGEFIALSGPDGVTVIDSLSFGLQSENISQGRMPDGSDTWRSQTPTPGSTNLVTVLNQVNINPFDFRISAFPNPFNNSIQINYVLPTIDNISVTIFDINGRIIWQKEINNHAAGSYTLKWEGRTRQGNYVSSGQYIIQFNGRNMSETRRITLIK